MEVGKSNIFKVLDGTTQFIIPVYQRAYSWTAEHWYMPSEPHGEGDIAVELWKKLEPGEK